MKQSEEDEVWVVVFMHDLIRDYSVCNDKETADNLVLALARERFEQSKLKASGGVVTKEIEEALERDDADYLVRYWTVLTDFSEYFDRVGPIRVLEG